ncbi:TolC family protein [Spirosoma aerophilum]
MIFKKTLCFLLCIFAIRFIASAQIPLTLREVLQQVRTNSPTLRVERLTIAAAQADQVTANLRPNPILNNQTLFQLSSAQVPTLTAEQSPGVLSRQRRQFWLQATKEFDIFNKRQARNRFAEATTNLTFRSVAETERGLLFEAANRYLDARYARIQLELLQQAKNNADTLVQLNRVRLRDLVISSTDLLRTQLVAEQYGIQINTARQELHNRLNELRLVIGSVDSVSVMMNDSLVNTSFLKAIASSPVDSVLRLAMTDRTDIRGAEANLETARRNVDLQQVLARPRNEAGFIWNPQNTVPYAGVYLTLELPVYNRNQGGIQKSKVLQEQAAQSVSFLQTRVRLEIQTAYQSFLSSRQNVDRFTGIRADANRVLASVRYAYLRGATTLIDLLQAQSAWFDTQTAYYQAVYSYHQNYIRLLYATGQISIY